MSNSRAASSRRRFVFTKKQLQDEFVFSATGSWKTGLLTLRTTRFDNSTLPIGVRPERSQHSLYPSEVETRPSSLGWRGSVGGPISQACIRQK